MKGYRTFLFNIVFTVASIIALHYFPLPPEVAIAILGAGNVYLRKITDSPMFNG